MRFIDSIVRRGSISLVVACVLAASRAQANTLAFEDIWILCHNGDAISGPSTVTIQGVTFSTPYTTVNAGMDYGDNPFTSDSFHFSTFGSGTVIDFHQPIASLSFLVGVFTPQVQYPRFNLIVNGQIVATFLAEIATVHTVSLSFSSVVSQVTIQFIDGSNNVLGIDDLTFTTLSAPFCFGNGSGTHCPCGNAGAAGNGCASSVNAAGANLAATGSASVGSDTLVLTGSGMPESFALYFQGTAQSAGGFGSVFGDGLRCVAGSVVRLATKANSGGASQYPSAGDASISVQGAVASAGDLREYQCWYRNAASFCTAQTFNLTNGWEITWQL